MKRMRTFGVVTISLFGLAVLFRLAITMSGNQDSPAKLTGVLIGLSGGTALCWAIFALVMAPVGRSLTRVSRANPNAAVFAVVTDEHLDSALNDAGVERTRKSRFITLAADKDRVRLLGGRRNETIAAFEWAEIEEFSVGSATSKWSVSSWSNVIMQVRAGSRHVSIPLSTMPGRTVGNYTPTQIRAVIDAIEAKRPPDAKA